jgi:hypothetical protein
MYTSLTSLDCVSRTERSVFQEQTKDREPMTDRTYGDLVGHLAVWLQVLPSAVCHQFSEQLHCRFMSVQFLCPTRCHRSIER